MLKRALLACSFILFVLLWVSMGGVFADSGNEDDAERPQPEPTWQPPISISGDENPLSYANELQGTVITPPREIADFSMPSTTGEMYTFSQQGGKIQMVYFGYMTCPDVCPTTMADMLRAYRAVGEPSEQVQVIFITIDPERDTLERMAAYTAAFHEDFIGLRPETDEQLQSAMQNFGVIAERREVDSALGYLIDHSATVFLIAPDGRIVSQYPFGVPYTEMANDLQVLMDYMIAPNTVTATMEVVPHDPSREFRIVIPEGTNAQIMMGEDPGIIPLKINLTLGVQDILVLENHDNSDYLVGGIWVAPFETISKQFYEPQTFVGLCTVTVGRDLVEIIVSEPEQ